MGTIESLDMLFAVLLFGGFALFIGYLVGYDTGCWKMVEKQEEKDKNDTGTGKTDKSN